MVTADYIEIIGPALAVGLLIALVHAPLGVEVLRRGIVFIDLAIAQIAGLSAVTINTVIDEPSRAVIQGVSLLSAIVAAGFFRWVERRLPDEQEAIIGCCFVLAASAALLVLANHPHGGEEMEHILSGQILFVTWQDVFAYLPIYVTVLSLWLFWPGARDGYWFFLLLALAITASVQLVGVFVVFASLVLPALAVNPWREGKTRRAWIVAAGSVIAGITLSALFDLPSGPLMVLAFAVFAIGCRSFVFRRQG